MKSLSLHINGQLISASVEPRTSLADFLREIAALTGAHVGCEHGVCGACTVMIDGKPERSCITYAVQVEDRDVRSIEGFDTDNVMNALRNEFSKQHALQCGYCTPGMLITARDIVLRLGDPGEDRIREELAGNLCRCTGYAGIVRAIQNVGRAQETSSHRPTIASNFDTQTSAPSNLTFDTATADPASTRTVKSSRIKVAQSFVIESDIGRTWDLFQDVPKIAACIPGAELTSCDDRNWTGRIQVKIGPVRASMRGAGAYGLDPERKSGLLRGSGTDVLSRSRIDGTLEFTLKELSAQSTQVDVSLSYAVQGVLAHFSRSAIMHDFINGILRRFAANCEAAMSGKAQDDHAPKNTRSILERLASVLGFLFGHLNRHR